MQKLVCQLYFKSNAVQAGDFMKTLLRNSSSSRIRHFHSSSVQAFLSKSRNELNSAKRVIVKLGSAVVTKPTRGRLALGRLASIVEQMAGLCYQGKQCALVTSGAIALGKHHLGFNPKESSRGARAAVGMAEMVSLYGRLFEECDLRSASVLLTPIDFDDEHRRTYWRQALQDLMSRGIVPIINTNDAVDWGHEASEDNGNECFKEPPVRDNDSLAARLASELSADILLLVSNVNGVYTTPPGNPGSELINCYEVTPMSDEDAAPNGNSNQNVEFGTTSDVGTGGMQSKVNAAEWTVRQGTSVVVCNGDRPNVITDVIAGKNVGTFFTMTKDQGSLATTETTVAIQSKEIANKVRDASYLLVSAGCEARVRAIEYLADSLVDNQMKILEENSKDMDEAEVANLQPSLLARLKLNSDKLHTLSVGLKQIADQCTAERGYIGGVLQRTKLADDLILEKVVVPIGVLMVIFESRPDCLPQIAALSIATANGLLAKPGREAVRTVSYLHKLVADALEKAGLPREAIGLLVGRKEVEYILGESNGQQALVDMVIPRGSGSMIKNIRETVNRAGTGVPVLGHGAGICHVYIDENADPEKAVKIAIDSKCNYPAACNAMETLLVHRSHVATGLLKDLCEQLKKNSVEVFSGPKLTELVKTLNITATPTNNLSQEYSDLKCTIELVDSTEEAIQCIATHGSGHTETIVTENEKMAETFLQKLNSACVFLNASTRFADGYRFGLGAEVGINTGRVYARGPVGVEGLLITKWVLRGSGQVVSEFNSGNKSFLHEKLPID